MENTAYVRVKVDQKLKLNVETVFKKMGLTTTEAINLFYRHVNKKRKLLFEKKIPNKKTVKTFLDTDRKKNVVKSKNVKELFDDLGI